MEMIHSPRWAPYHMLGPRKHPFQCSLGLFSIKVGRGSLIGTICNCGNAEVKQRARSQSKNVECEPQSHSSPVLPHP